VKDPFDFRVDMDDTNRPRGCGYAAYPALLLVAFLVLTVLWMAMHRHALETAAVVVIEVGLAALLVRELVRRYPARAKRLDPSGVPVPLAEVTAGVVHTAGIVGFFGQPLNGPLGTPPSMFYRVLVEATDRHPPEVLFEGRSADEIVLEDGSGAKIVVKLDGARWLIDRYHAADDAAVGAYLAERGLDTTRPVRVRVQWIAAHELVYVRGAVRSVGEDDAGYRTSERARLEMASAPNRPLSISLEALTSARSRPS
jgi:hypothetical protein